MGEGWVGGKTGMPGEKERSLNLGVMHAAPILLA